MKKPREKEKKQKVKFEPPAGRVPCCPRCGAGPGRIVSMPSEMRCERCYLRSDVESFFMMPLTTEILKDS